MLPASHRPCAVKPDGAYTVIVSPQIFAPAEKNSRPGSLRRIKRVLIGFAGLCAAVPMLAQSCDRHCPAAQRNRQGCCKKTAPPQARPERGVSARPKPSAPEVATPASAVAVAKPAAVPETALEKNAYPVHGTLVYHENQVNEPARRVYYEDPVYPETARAQGLTGTVILEIVIAENGAVLEARILRSDNPVFSATAMAAARKWRYTPAKRNGRIVRVFKSVLIRYGMH